MTTLFLAIQGFDGWAQQRNIGGRVIDGSTGENLIGAVIVDQASSIATTTNEFGFFALSVKSSTLSLHISLVGYNPALLNLSLSGDTLVTVKLIFSNDLPEVVVEDNNAIPFLKSVGQWNMPSAQVESSPALMGEQDLTKTIQQLPGVQAGFEGQSGYYVRGGGVGHNLILLDGAPVYNPYHLFDFLSIFNTDALNTADFYKSFFPGRYGGRLSSVLDVRTKDGSLREKKGSGSVGLLGAHLTFETPLRKEKSSLIVSARRSWADLLARPLMSNGDRTMGYSFYDINAKVNHQFNANSRLYLSIYNGQDKGLVSANNTIGFLGPTRTEVAWGNLIGGARWNKVLSSKAFLNVSGSYTKYEFSNYDKRVQRPANESERSFTSSIDDFSLKADLDYRLSSKHALRFGTHLTQYELSPGTFHGKLNGQISDFINNRISAVQADAYIEDEFTLNALTTVNYGLRASSFISGKHVEKSFEPRARIAYEISQQVTISASWSSMTQYLHMLQSSGLGLPTTIWIPSSSTIKPEKSNIISIGSSITLGHKYALTLEGYYNAFDKLLDYRNGERYRNLDRPIDEKVMSGKGRSVGAEVLLTKTGDRLTGWIGYTLSKTSRQFEQLNDGQSIPFRFDRRHNFELTVNHQFTKHKRIGFTWFYATGAALSIPLVSYESRLPGDESSNEVKTFDRPNNFRAPSTHRLDISYTTTKVKKFGERSWVLGLYNAYNAFNPFFFEVVPDASGKNVLKKRTLLPVLPSVAYRIKF